MTLRLAMECAPRCWRAAVVEDFAVTLRHAHGIASGEEWAFDMPGLEFGVHLLNVISSEVERPQLRITARVFLANYPMPTYHVYILTNQSRTLYIGMTSDLMRRMEEHRSGAVSGFTSQYNVTQLVYYETTEDVQAAIARERQLKRWRRSKKLGLVDAVNPGWRDLGRELLRG